MFLQAAVQVLCTNTHRLTSPASLSPFVHKTAGSTASLPFRFSSPFFPACGTRLLSWSGSARGGPIGRRDAAMIGILLGGGLRRFELVALDLKDFDPQTGELKIQKGKGKKGRVVWLTNGSADALSEWLNWTRGRTALLPGHQRWKDRPQPNRRSHDLRQATKTWQRSRSKVVLAARFKTVIRLRIA